MAGKVSSDPNVFILPDLGEGLEEAELISWKVSAGDTVDELEVIAEMETDKALVEVPSPRAGTIKTLHGEAGDTIKVGAPFVTYEGGADAPAAAPEAPEADAAPADAGSSGGEDREDAGTVVGQMSDHVAGMTSKDGKALASPAVRRYARDKGVDINSVAGSGIGGRVTKKDVDAAVSGGGAAPASAPAQTAESRDPQPQQHQQTQQSPPQQQQPRRPDTRRPLNVPSTPIAAQYAPQQPSAPVPHPAPPYGYAPPPQYPPQYPVQHPGYGYAPPPQYPPQYPGQYQGGYGPQYPPMPQQSPGLAPAPGYQGPGAYRPIPDPAQASRVGPGEGEARTPFRGVRRTIANRLRESVDTCVHFTVMDEADATALDGLRKEVSAQTGVKLSMLPFVCAAVAKSLAGRFGAMNAHVNQESEEIVEYGAVHLGIATDTGSGLMVPVIRDADRMNVVELAQAIAQAASSARDRSIPREQLMGSTFTISNVGSHAGRFATPVINAPEVGILAIGKAYDGVVVREGQAMVGKLLPLSLACDHRVVDGATAALALAEIVESIQCPESLL